MSFVLACDRSITVIYVLFKSLIQLFRRSFCLSVKAGTQIQRDALHWFTPLLSAMMGQRQELGAQSRFPGEW